MTEFATELRHYCRNPRCRSKLPKPVANPREAFCARGCHSGFYRKRCLVCEGPMERRTERQRICRKSKCHGAFRARIDLGRYHVSSDVVSPSKNVDFIGSKQPLKPDRAWRVVAAGKPIPASVFYWATIPDGPNCLWEGGEYQRLEKRDTAAL